MKICNELLWIHIQLGIISNWGYTHTGANCQMVVTCCHLGIPLRQMLLQLRIRIQLGILSNWGYTHTGANCQTVVTRCHLGIPLLQMLLQLWIHIQLGVLSNWDMLTLGQTVRCQSRGKVLASLYNRHEYICGYTYNWRYSQTGDTLSLETNCQTSFM